MNLLFALKIREFIEMISNANKASRDSAANQTVNATVDSESAGLNSMMVDNQAAVASADVVTSKSNGSHKPSSSSEEAMDMDATPMFLSKSPADLLKTTTTTTTNGNGAVAGPNMSFLEFDYTNLQSILQFGRELFQMNATIDNGENPTNSKMLRVSEKNFIY